jgi:hypothetical protein
MEWPTPIGLVPPRNVMSFIRQIVVMFNGIEFDLSLFQTMSSCSHCGFIKHAHLSMSMLCQSQLVILKMKVICSCLSHLKKWFK